MYIFYYLFIIFPIIISPLKKRASITKGFLIVVVCIGVLVGFRSPGVDRDYASYVHNYFDDVPKLIDFFSMEKLLSREPGIRLVASLFYKTIGFSLPVTLALLSGTAVFLKIKSLIKLSTALYPLMIIIYLSNFFLLHEMTQIRIGMATAFFFWSLQDLVKDDGKRFVLKNTIGFLFHYTAIIFLLYWFFRRKKSFVVFLGLTIIVFFAAVLVLYLNLNVMRDWLLDSFFAPYLSRIIVYFVDASINAGHINFFNPIIWFRLFLWLAIVLAPPKHRDFPIDTRLVTIIKYSYGLGLLLFFGLYQLPALSNRLSQMFFVLDPVAIPVIIRYYFTFRSTIILTVLIGLSFLSANLFLIKLVSPFTVG